RAVNCSRWPLRRRSPVEPWSLHRRLPGLAPLDRSGSLLPEDVGGVLQSAGLQAQAAAADAAVEVAAQVLELADSGIELVPPSLRQPCPVLLRRGASLRQRIEGRADVLERNADALRHPDECH